MPRQLHRLTVAHVQEIAHALAVQTMGWDEPIPPFETRFPYVLESCVAMPFQTFDGKLLYRGLLEKAAALFYLLIKDHPFQNGNKRLAVTATLVFLLLNGHWLALDQKALYNFAVWVASSDPAVKDDVQSAIARFFGKHLVKVPASGGGLDP
jgi:death-on-curing protein